MLEKEVTCSLVSTEEKKYRILCDLGYAAFESGMLEKANLFAEHALQLDNKGADPYCIKAKIAAQHLRFQDALVFINKARMLDPELALYEEVKNQIKKQIQAINPDKESKSNNEESKVNNKYKRPVQDNSFSSAGNINLRVRNYFVELEKLQYSLKHSVKYDNLAFLFTEAEDLLKQQQGISWVNKLSQAILNAGLAFASASESALLKDKIKNYMHALHFYRLANSFFHIAAACHHLAHNHEKLYSRNNNYENHIFKSYFFYKQALGWYKESRSRITLDKQEWIDIINHHINNVTIDIQQLEEKNTSLATSARDYFFLFYPKSAVVEPLTEELDTNNDVKPTRHTRKRLV